MFRRKSAQPGLICRNQWSRQIFEIRIRSFFTEARQRCRAGRSGINLCLATKPGCQTPCSLSRSQWEKGGVGPIYAVLWRGVKEGAILYRLKARQKTES